MELIIQILMLFIFINCILKLSFWKPLQTGIFSLICAVFVVVAYQYAILQSKTQINDYLQNKKLLQDAAVLVTLESAIYFSFCVAALREMFGKKVKKWVQPLYWYPGLLIFPVLFYCLTQAIFSMSGTDFATIAYVFGVIVAIAFPLLSYVIRYLVPEKDLLLEIHFLVSLFVCILGLITTVDGNVTYAATDGPINFKAIGLSLALFAVAFFIGFVWNKIKWSIRQKKNSKNKN